MVYFPYSCPLQQDWKSKQLWLEPRLVVGVYNTDWNFIDQLIKIPRKIETPYERYVSSSEQPEME